MDIKEFKKNVRNSCKFIAPPEKRKECKNIFMCNWNNCNKEQKDFASTRLTDADRKSCKNKDINKEFDCEDKLTKKKKVFDKYAALSHCTVNKCPKIQKFIKKASHDLTKSLNIHFKKNSIMAQHKTCMKEHCTKEVQKRDKHFELLDKHDIKCTKKFGTYKEQTKCSNKKLNKQTKQIMSKASDCRKKYCDKQLSNSNSNSNSKSKSNRNSKSTKTS